MITENDFKQGDVIKCIEAFCAVAYLTVGKNYEILWTTPNWIYIEDDHRKTVALINKAGQFVLSDDATKSI